MQSLRTSALILRRINYGEADRILTLLTKDYGKRVLIAKGVRKIKSKLAGGIELFSESDISFIAGKSDIGTLISTRLIRHFSDIHADLQRLKIAGEFLKRIDTVTENDTSSDYYDVVVETFKSLNTKSIPATLTDAWSMMRLLLLLGEAVDVQRDASGNHFDEQSRYSLSAENSRFIRDNDGPIEPSVIKLLRMLGRKDPSSLTAIIDVDTLADIAANCLHQAYLYNRPKIIK